MIGGKEHVSDLNALLAGMSDEYYELKEAISQSSGKLEEMYDIMQDTVQGKMASLSSKLEAIGLKFYDAFEKPIKAILDRLIELSDWFLKLPDSVVVAIGIIGGIVVVLVPVLLMIGMIANAISNMVSLWGMVQTAMIGMEIAIAPILAIVGAIVALGVALVVAYNKCEWFRNVVNETFAFIKDFVLQMWDEITKAVQNFVDFATPYVQAFLSAMSQWWTETKANIVNMWVEFQAWFAPYWETIKDVLSTVWEGIKTVFNDAIEIIVKGVKDHFNRLKEFWEEHGETIIDLFTTVWNAIETVFTTVIEGIKNFVTTKFEFLKKFWEEHGENIKTIFKAVWDAIKFIFETVISKISEHIVNNFRKIAEWWETWGEDVKHGFSVLWDVVCAIFETAWNIITGKCQMALDIIGGIIDVIAKLIKGDFAGAFESAKETIKKVVDTICGLVQNIINAWNGIGDKIAGFFSGIGDKIAKQFSGLGDKIMNMFPSWLRTLIGGGNPFKSMVSNAVNSLTGMFRSVEAPKGKQTEMVATVSIPSPYGLMDNIAKHDINYGRDAYANSAYISSSSADSRNFVSNLGSPKESILNLNGIDQLVNQNNQLINLLTQFISNQQDSGFTITVEHMEVKDKSDIRSIAREMEELRKLQVLARGGV